MTAWLTGRCVRRDSPRPRQLWLPSLDEPGEEAELLRAELHADGEFAASAKEGDERRISETMRLRTKALAARRNRLLAMRDDGVIGDETFQQLEKELDFVDLALGGRT